MAPVRHIIMEIETPEVDEAHDIAAWYMSTYFDNNIFEASPVYGDLTDVKVGENLYELTEMQRKLANGSHTSEPVDFSQWCKYVDIHWLRLTEEDLTRTVYAQFSWRYDVKRLRDLADAN